MFDPIERSSSEQLITVMKKYKVNVNGNLYEITLEVVDEKDVAAAPAEKTAGIFLPL